MKPVYIFIKPINGSILFSNTQSIYNIAETVKANNLKPYDYYVYFLTVISEHMEHIRKSKVFSRAANAALN